MTAQNARIVTSQTLLTCTGGGDRVVVRAVVTISALAAGAAVAGGEAVGRARLALADTGRRLEGVLDASCGWIWWSQLRFNRITFQNLKKSNK